MKKAVAIWPAIYGNRKDGVSVLRSYLNGDGKRRRTILEKNIVSVVLA
jgi:hypothetical protein